MIFIISAIIYWLSSPTGFFEDLIFNVNYEFCWTYTAFISYSFIMFLYFYTIIYPFANNETNIFDDFSSRNRLSTNELTYV